MNDFNSAERNLRIAVERGQLGNLDALLYGYFKIARSVVNAPDLDRDLRRTYCENVLTTIEWLRGMLLVHRQSSQEKLGEVRKANRFIWPPTGPQALHLEF